MSVLCVAELCEAGYACRGAVLYTVMFWCVEAVDMTLFWFVEAVLSLCLHFRMQRGSVSGTLYELGPDVRGTVP